MASGEIGFAEQRRERLRSVLPALGRPLDLVDTAALDELFADYLRGTGAAWRAFPGSRDLLDELRSRGYRLGLLTNGDADNSSATSSTGPGSAMPSTSSTLGAEGLQKRTSGAFTGIARTLGVAPSVCLFVGDGPRSGRRRRHVGRVRGLLVDRDATGPTPCGWPSSAPWSGPPRTVRGVTDSLLHTLVGVLLLVAVATAS